jgi:hypothetical protein
MTTRRPAGDRFPCTAGGGQVASVGMSRVRLQGALARLRVLAGCLALVAVAAAPAGPTPADPPGAARPLYGESHALVVGISDYTAGWPDLESVPRELEQVQQVLAAQGFSVVKRLDLDGESLKKAFEAFIAEHGYDPENRLLFFFAGHGHTWNEAGHGYLVPADAPLPAMEGGDPGPEFLRRALHMSQVLAWSRQMTAKHALFLFDSCFSGTIFKTRALPPRPPHITQATALPVREFITAGTAGEEVPAQSVFTPAIVDALRYGWADLNEDGYISGVELGLYLQSKVPQHAPQSPQFGKHPDYHLSRGDFLFETRGEREAARSPPAREEAAPAAPPPPPPLPFSGHLQVNVNVPATVHVGGEPMGEARPGQPVNRQGLPVGPAEVRVVAPGYAPATRVVQVRQGQWEQVVVELRPVVETATLTVRSNVRGDTVYIDGNPRGSTRLDVELPPGLHTVRVEKDGHLAHEERVSLRAGEPAVVVARLTPVQTAPTPAAPPASQAAPSRPRPPEAAAPRPKPARPAPPADGPCLRRCEEGRERCEQQRPATDPQQCREAALAHCRGVSQRCRAEAGFVGGSVSIDADCTGQQVQCEKARLAGCEPSAGASARCEEEAARCRTACGP